MCRAGKNLHPDFLAAQSSFKVTIVIVSVFSPTKPKYMQLRNRGSNVFS